MTANEYQQDALRTCGALPSDGAQLLNGVVKLSGDAQECLNVLRDSMANRRSVDRDRMAEKLGEVVWSLAVCADAIGYDMESILTMNVDRLMAKYPDRFKGTHYIFEDKTTFYKEVSKDE